jgi:predicted phosphoadenosine phosphosulfate sulfurtransferase
VAGANYGKLYNHTNINKGRVKKPDGITWKEYLSILLQELPPLARKNFEEKFEITFHYHKVMYEEKEGISPDIYIQDSRKAARDKVKETGLPLKMFISYETLCGAVIKRDFVFEKYGFGYSKKMYERIKEMQEKWKDL